MLRLLNVEEISGLMLKVPELVDAHQRKDPLFSDKAAAWLSSVEVALTSNRLGEAARVAGLRGMIISARQGTIPGTATGPVGQSRRKATAGVAADALRQASDLLAGILQPDQKRLTDCATLMRQVIAVARYHKIIVQKDPAMSLSDHLQLTWRLMLASPQTAAGCVQIQGLASAQEILILLDRALAAQ